MTLSSTYRAAHLEISFNMTVTTGNATPTAVVLTQNPVHRVRMRTFSGTQPVVGTLPSAIDIRLRGGGLKKLDLAIQDYAFNVIRPRYRIGGGASGGGISFGSAEVKWFPENSTSAVWITGHSFPWGAWVNAVGANGYANQLIVTFRSGSGRISKLVFMHGIDIPGATRALPSGDAGIDAMVADAVGINSPLIGLDGLPLIIGMEWNAGQNERAWSKFFRPS